MIRIFAGILGLLSVSKTVIAQPLPREARDMQQIQKYECGANRISAARLWQLAEALETPVGYFYDGLAEAVARENAAEERSGEMFSRKETLHLIQAYYRLSERPRRRLLDLAKSLHNEPEPA